MISKSEIGELGEKLVSGYFRSLGSNVKRSEDKYDMYKDLIVDGRNVEVKTQNIYRLFPFGSKTHHAFSVHINGDNNGPYSNQLNKCLYVDRLIFVSRPIPSDKFVRIYEAPPVGQRKFSVHQNSDNRNFIAGFLINTMSLLIEIDNENIVEKLMFIGRTYES